VIRTPRWGGVAAALAGFGVVRNLSSFAALAP